MPDELKAVLDASALMAHLNDEEGANAVRDAMQNGACISVVNWAEVLSKAADAGDDPAELAAELADAVAIEALTEADCVQIAKLRPLTRDQGLSLADRACVALAKRLGLPVLSADRQWRSLDIGLTLQLIR